MNFDRILTQREAMGDRSETETYDGVLFESLAYEFDGDPPSGAEARAGRHTRLPIEGRERA